MGGKSQLFTVVIENSPLIHYGKGNTVQDLLHFHVVHLHVAKNRTRPHQIASIARYSQILMLSL